MCTDDESRACSNLLPHPIVYYVYIYIYVSKGYSSSSSACDQRKYAAATVYRYDLRYTASLDPVAAYEECLFVSTLAGLVNREEPLLYYDYLPHDDYWFEYMRSRPFFNKTKG